MPLPPWQLRGRGRPDRDTTRLDRSTCRGLRDQFRAPARGVAAARLGVRSACTTRRAHGARRCGPAAVRAIAAVGSGLPGNGGVGSRPDLKHRARGPTRVRARGRGQPRAQLHGGASSRASRAPGTRGQPHGLGRGSGPGAATRPRRAAVPGPFAARRSPTSGHTRFRSTLTSRGQPKTPAAAPGRCAGTGNHHPRRGKSHCAPRRRNKRKGGSSAPAGCRASSSPRA